MIRARPLREADVDHAAQILVGAFAQIYRQRGHTPPFPNLDSAVWLCRSYLELDPDGCVIAEVGDLPVGVGFVHLRGASASIGPIAARPGGPRGVGQVLMAYVSKLTAGCTSVRLFQDAFNPDSFGLYARLGFVVRDVAPYLLATELKPAARAPAEVRAGRPEDRARIEDLDRRLIGADRARDIEFLTATGSVLVLEHRRALDGFLFLRSLPARAVVGPAVATSEEGMCALLDAASLALPGRSAVMRASGTSPRVLQLAFERGFRVDHLGNLMVAGPIKLPPSQLYALFPDSL